MIRQLRIGAFKRYASLNLPLGGLTVLTGLNGGGKTTVLHALLLLRQVASRTTLPSEARLNGIWGLALGEAQDVLHNVADPADGIRLGVELDDGVVYDWTFTVDETATHQLVLPVRDLPATKLPDGALNDPGRAFQYLCAERLGPRDTLGVQALDERYLSVGVQGEYLAQVLAVLDRHAVDSQRLHPQDTELHGLKAQTERWLAEIARPLQLEATWPPGTLSTTLRYREPQAGGDWVKAANMGFGVSYALPVIVGGLLAPKGGLLLVENPEAHLHPQGQSAMGAFLARIAASGVQVVVETHSDHVLNGVRRAVAIDKTVSADDVRIHWFGREPEPTSLTLSPGGDLSGWPEGFFDQIDADLDALSRARRGAR